jgi:hypothetical protein
MLSIIQIYNSYEKYGRVYCYLSHPEKKPLSISQISSWFTFKSPWKMTGRLCAKTIFKLGKVVFGEGKVVFIGG